MSSSNSILKFQGVSFIRDRRKILDHINFEVKEGEHWAILGLNGSGKSTLLSLITAYNVASEGTVEVLGNEFGKTLWMDIKRQVGYYSSTLEKFNPTLFTETVENIILSGLFSTIGLYNQPENSDILKKEELIQQFSLENVKDKKYRFLSQGEKRKTLVCRALINNPKLLVLDEPCAGLDIQSREELLRNIESIATSAKTTVLMVTHDTEEIVPAITSVCLLKNGKLLSQGKKEDILTDDNLSLAYNCQVKIFQNASRYYTIVQ